MGFLGTYDTLFLIADLVLGREETTFFTSLTLKKYKKEGERIMKELNEIAKQYLDKNGVTKTFFANYIGCNVSVCHRWLNGQRKLRSYQIKKVHDFLSGKYITSVEDIIEGGE